MACYRKVLLGFETDHHFIVAGYDGVKILDSKSDLAADEYDVFSEGDAFGCDSAETVMFKGERIQEVVEEKNKYIIHLDHFDMTIFVYAEVFDYSCWQNIDIPIKAAEHCIKRKCTCGGTAEVMLDFVSDFGVRCNKCHLSTYHTYVLQRVIDDWENEVDLHVSETGKDLFYNNLDKTIRCIVADKELSEEDEGSDLF